ncbi:MAG: hypothetical protein K8R86_05720 [Bacteroidales bacterium]|nr:hypothetical protein [Bacteroidales bacterium]
MNRFYKSGIFWSIVLGILGILATVFYYELGKNEIDVVYSIKRTPSLIFNKNAIDSKIQLLVNDSTLVSENTYISTIVIWNRGRREVNLSDVRKNILIKPSSKGDILDYSILSETHPEVCNFKLTDLDTCLQLSWNYFDPGFGLEVQLIYSCGSDPDIYVVGYLLGCDIKKIDAEEKSAFFSPAFNFLLFIVGLIGFAKVFEKKENKFSFRIHKKTLIIMFIIILILVLTRFVFVKFIYDYFPL